MKLRRLSEPTPRRPRGPAAARFAAVLAGSILIAGCLKPLPHLWLNAGDFSGVRVHTRAWESIAPDHYGLVEPLAQAEAVGLLETEAGMRLSVEDARQFCPTLLPPEAPGMRAYLVRSVVHGNGPTVTTIRADRRTGAMHIHHDTYDGGNWIYRSGQLETRPVAMVVYADFELHTVFPTAWLAGDGIFIDRSEVTSRYWFLERNRP